jgi:hypothetical protein
MKYYEYQGKVYASHNKEALVRRLFVPTIGPWGEKKIRRIDEKKALIKRLFRYNPKTKTGENMNRKPKLTRKEKQTLNSKGPAQAWFPAGRAHAFIGQDAPKKYGPKDKQPLAPKCKGTTCPQCGPNAKFKTVKKAEKKYGCKRCGAVVQD